MKPLPILLGAIISTTLVSYDAPAFVAAPSVSCARVTSITPGSAADKVGLEVDDQILAIDDKPVKSTDDYYRLLAGKKKVTLMVKNGRRTGYSMVECPVVNGRIGIRFLISKT